MKSLSRFAPFAFLLCPLAFIAFGCSKDSNPTTPPAGPAFDTNTQNSGTIFVFTFTQDGSFAYHCKNHGGMTGTVMASAAGVDSPTVNVGQGGNLFSPATVNVKTGSYVKWVWVASGHTVTRP